MTTSISLKLKIFRSCLDVKVPQLKSRDLEKLSLKRSLEHTTPGKPDWLSPGWKSDNSFCLQCPLDKSVFSLDMKRRLRRGVWTVDLHTIYARPIRAWFMQVAEHFINQKFGRLFVSKIPIDTSFYFSLHFFGVPTFMIYCTWYSFSTIEDFVGTLWWSMYFLLSTWFP